MLLQLVSALLTAKQLGLGILVVVCELGRVLCVDTANHFSVVVIVINSSFMTLHLIVIQLPRLHITTTNP